jgi:hypothetical protein
VCVCVCDTFAGDRRLVIKIGLHFENLREVLLVGVENGIQARVANHHHLRHPQFVRDR